MKLTAIDKALGVGESTGQGKAKAIRTMLKIRPMDPAWSLRSQIKDNPMAWTDALILLAFSKIVVTNGRLPAL